MSFAVFLISTSISLLLILSVYYFSDFGKIKNCYQTFFDVNYWTKYNIVEFLSWFTKACIIIPGLIFDIKIWWFYFFALFTSLTLIWASNGKKMPTLIGFNTIWVWICCVVLTKHFI
jgi:hypothetical protein